MSRLSKYEIEELSTNVLDYNFKFHIFDKKFNLILMGNDYDEVIKCKKGKYIAFSKHKGNAIYLRNGLKRL